jgi:hypothetical protein
VFFLFSNRLGWRRLDRRVVVASPCHPTDAGIAAAGQVSRLFMLKLKQDEWPKDNQPTYLEEQKPHGSTRSLRRAKGSSEFRRSCSGRSADQGMSAWPGPVPSGSRNSELPLSDRRTFLLNAAQPPATLKHPRSKACPPTLQARSRSMLFSPSNAINESPPGYTG